MYDCFRAAKFPVFATSWLWWSASINSFDAWSSHCGVCFAVWALATQSVAAARINKATLRMLMSFLAMKLPPFCD
jgi:hypothetical protein